MTTQQQEKIRSTGVVFVGECHVKVSDRCEAKNGTPRPITAVHLWDQGLRQVDVCTPCLDEKIKRGEWVSV